MLSIFSIYEVFTNVVTILYVMQNIENIENKLSNVFSRKKNNEMCPLEKSFLVFLYLIL